MRLLATTCSFGEALLTVLEVAVLLVWIWVAITVIADLLTSGGPHSRRRSWSTRRSRLSCADYGPRPQRPSHCR